MLQYRIKYLYFCLLLSMSCMTQLIAAPYTALGYTPKYAKKFTHFDYVNPDAPRQGELTLYSLGNFNSFNPFLLKSTPAEGLGNLVFESLMVASKDEPFSMYGLLANDIRLAKDKLSVTFRLNPKARFSDGSKVTAEDVKFSFDILKSKQVHPQYRIFWADIKEAKVIKKDTIRFYFVKVNPELHLIAGQIPIFSKQFLEGKVFNKVINEPLLASGPYTIEKSKQGKFVTYKRNPDYWANELNTRKGMFNFNKITFKYYKDTSVALEALKAGDFDFMAVHNSKEWARSYVGGKFESGEILKQELPHENNAGMQGFIFNLRRPIFQDINVRKAINLAFDFEWANKNLFYEQYARCDSYFSNSELASSGLPSKAELALLTPFKDKLPAEIFTQAWQPASTLAPNSLRANLRQAKRLLTNAGWVLKDGVLQKEGMRLEFSVMLAQQAFERILAPFARNLKKLGIILNYRTVDLSLYQRRMETFDFDMTVTVFSQSQSPGNEMVSKWHSSTVEQEGSSNLIGLNDPIIDHLIEKAIYAPNRQALVTAIHALDRVLLQGEYLVPNWYTGLHRIAFWKKFGQPKTVPLYYNVSTWMMETWWMSDQTDKAAPPTKTE